ncbi:hypothetical protein RB594_002582 [Gaeumannomyces avenae]
MDASMDPSMDFSMDSTDPADTPFSQKGSQSAAPAPTSPAALDDHGSDVSSSDDKSSSDAMTDDSDQDGSHDNNHDRSSSTRQVRSDHAATAPNPHAARHDTQDATSRKRKAQSGQHHDDTSTAGTQKGEAGAGLQQAKKVKLNGDEGAVVSADGSHVPRDRSLLPAEIWHCVFTFCPPKSLGNLMSVNKSFHSYLDPSLGPSSAPERQPACSGGAAILKPNAIWQASRRLYWPCMPTPLKSKTELDMWKLACSISCQDCGKPGNPANVVSGEACANGPGMDGVAIVWSFSACLCGPCLLSKSVKEIDLLLSSSTPSMLMPAIPFVLLTDKLHVLSSSLAERGQLPKDAQLTKVFWRPGVESVKQEFLSVKGMGVATTEEWLKGLEVRGTEHQQDSSRWEKYAISGGITRMRRVLYPGYDPKSLVSVISTSANATPPSLSCDGSNVTIPHVSASNFVTGIPSLPPRAPVSARHERTREEVAELKATRKAEIERKAMLLDPPMRPSLLLHMPSFQAATQIITPLDDNAWELLKPRLLAQRQDAEKREKEAALQASLQEQMAEQNTTSDASKEKEPSDHDWDEIQGPLRGRISRHADEVIRKNWDDGDKVTKDTCADFAADVLLYVRKHFYADVARDADVVRASGKEPIVDPPKGPFTQKLTLENMKWIFDVKIKPHTESLRKELFLCSACQGNFKYYGFEGVVQHYAAKHTSALSAGNVVVHWRAEWPEASPFSPDPRAVKQAYHQARHAIYRQENGNPQYPYGSYPGAPPQPYLPQPPAPYQAPPVPAPYGASQPYPEQFGAAPPQTYPPPGGYPQPQPGYGQAPYHATPAPYQQFPPPPAPVTSYPPSSYGAPVPGPVTPAAQAGPPPPPSGAYSYNYNSFQSNGNYAHPGGQAAPFPDRYRAQLEEMAKLSRELWSSTANLKDLPGSARLQVIIYHMAKRFYGKFSEPPPLTMFIDGLSNNKDMRPVRNVNGLMCKACHSGLVNPPATEQDRRSFSMPQLANHFQSRHVEPAVNLGQYVPVPDWASGMILVPDFSSQSSFRKPAAGGGDSQKYQLLSEALPHFFQPAPHQGVPSQALADTQWPPKPEYPTHSQLPTSADHHERFYGSAGPGTGATDNMQLHATNGHGNGLPKVQSGGYYPQPSQQEQNGKNKKKKQGAKGQNGASMSRKGPDDRAPRTRTNEVSEREFKDDEEQERRQEEEIRAMWAADRAQTARLPSVPPVTQPGNGPAGAARVPGRHMEPMTEAPQARVGPPPRQIKEESLPSMSRIQAPLKTAYQPQPPIYHPSDHQPPNASDREGSDPLAALELYLDQERNRTSVDSRQQPTPRPGYGDDRHRAMSRDPHGSQIPSQDNYRHRYSTAGAEGSRRRSLSPVYVRYVDQGPPADKYRERSPPPPLHGEPLYRARQAPALEEVIYGRAPPREYYEILDEEPRPRQVEYEAYELVKARDAQGEYYIRRPVRRQPEIEGYYNSSHQAGPYSAGGPARREVSYAPYEQRARYPSRQPQPSYNGREPVTSRAAEPGPMSRADAAYYEEYDPHYPATAHPPPGPIARPERYR